MPNFDFEALDATGRRETGVIEEATEQLAYRTLQQRGWTVYLLQEQRGPSSPTPYESRQKPLLPSEEQARLAELLSLLFSAGLTATQALSIAGSALTHRQTRQLIVRVQQHVADGSSLADAFDASYPALSPLFISFLRVDDTANRLSALLRVLAEYFRSVDETRRRVSAALIYPTILILAAIGLILIVTFYLAPNLEPVYQAVGAAPPKVLSSLLWLNAWVQDFTAEIFTGLVLLFVGAAALSRVRRVRRMGFATLARLPLIGEAIRFGALARLTYAMQLLLESGNPLVASLRTAADSLGSQHLFGSVFRDAAARVESGGRASEVFKGAQGIPEYYTEVLDIGERANRLSEVLPELARSLDQTARGRVDALVNLMAPVLTLLIGAGVGLLIYAIMGAILEVSSVAL
ncbi:MAG: type II secretion system F family protein [Rhodobacteraceae bacterium]|jgi:general secretion pathway protein F|nr:type II secretion system F family protein [Paracoccaceae bacterium]MBL4556630.1 type II secretion system F family protein [Paracoccaceae bacterium]